MSGKNLEQRVKSLEKEVADLKRQLEDQPQCIGIPLSVIKFEDLFYDVKRLNKEELNELVSQIETDLEKRLSVSISFN